MQIDIIGSSPKRLEAFLQGRVAAAMLTPPASDKALAAGGVLLANSEAVCAELAAHLRMDSAALAGFPSRVGRAIHTLLGCGDGLVAAGGKP